MRTPVGEALKIGKDAVASLLAPIKDVVAILDVVGSVHPAVSVGITFTNH